MTNPNFLVALALFIAFGGLLIGLATWLTTTKGNTISDILNSNKFASVEALRVEILNKVNASTMLPIVALYALGAAAPIAGIYVYTRSMPAPAAQTLLLTGTFRLPQQADVGRLCLVPEATTLAPSGVFQVPVLNRDEPHFITLRGRDTLPITLTVMLNDQKVLIANTANAGDAPTVFPFVTNGGTAQISEVIPITLAPADPADSTAPQDVPSVSQAPVDPRLQPSNEPIQ
jgi:hypothetical protein